MARYLIPLGIFLALVVFFAIGLQRDPKLVPSPLIGKSVPSFQLPQLKQPDQGFSDQHLRGRVSLVNVWASWCAECRVEHPFLMQLAKNNVIPIYGLNYKDGRADALRWLNQFGDPYQAIGFDEKGRVGLDWGVYGVPETFVVDRFGMIRYKQIGPITPQVWETKIRPVIAELEAQQ